jgi:hypothetical protein
MANDGTLPVSLETKAPDELSSNFSPSETDFVESDLEILSCY